MPKIVCASCGKLLSEWELQQGRCNNWRKHIHNTLPANATRWFKPYTPPKKLDIEDFPIGDEILSQASQLKTIKPKTRIRQSRSRKINKGLLIFTAIFAIALLVTGIYLLGEL